MVQPLLEYVSVTSKMSVITFPSLIVAFYLFDKLIKPRKDMSVLFRFQDLQIFDLNLNI